MVVAAKPRSPNSRRPAFRIASVVAARRSACFAISFSSRNSPERPVDFPTSGRYLPTYSRFISARITPCRAVKPSKLSSRWWKPATMSARSSNFYAPDASTRENTGEPVVGRDVLMAKERGVMAAFRKIEAARHRPSPDRRRHRDGALEIHLHRRRRLVAHPGRNRLADLARRQLIEERFFYDPRQMA